jgi:pimeloyl-ACP methyl ester carboxylesterase
MRYEASGMTFEALAWGPDDAPLALCLHGYPDTAYTWRFLGPELASRGWRVVAPFMRGYAPTDLAPDGNYQVGALVRDVVESHVALGGDGRAVLIGHDWGGIAAYAGAAHARGRFRRVVVLAIPPMGDTLGLLLKPAWLAGNLPVLARQLRCSWYIFFQQLPGISEAALDKVIPRLWADWSPGYDATEDVARVFEALDSPARRTAALRYYRSLVQPWYRAREYASEQRDMLRLPREPTLYLHGATDGCLRPALFDRALSVLPAGSETELVEDAGHFLQLERPGYVNDRIARFIAQ